MSGPLSRIIRRRDRCGATEGVRGITPDRRLLAPAAVAALRKSWERGNPAGAIEILKALAFLKPPAADRSGPMTFAMNIGEADIDAEILSLVEAADKHSPSG